MSPRTHLLKSLPPCDATRRWGLGELVRQEGRAPMQGIGELLDDTRQLASPLCLPPCDTGSRRWSETWKRVFTRPPLCWLTGLSFPTSRTVRANFCCLEAPQAMALCYGSLSQGSTHILPCLHTKVRSHPSWHCLPCITPFAYMGFPLPPLGLC